jgi:hypothetical protein
MGDMAISLLDIFAESTDHRRMKRYEAGLSKFCRADEEYARRQVDITSVEVQRL